MLARSYLLKLSGLSLLLLSGCAQPTTEFGVNQHQMDYPTQPTPSDSSANNPDATIKTQWHTPRKNPQGAQPPSH